MCKSKKQTEQTNPVTEEQYPRYLSNHPQGEDLFEGKSQERLANAIAMHITDTDKVENSVYARLVGLEGKWGSGKSNVIKILEDKLKENYTFFCFDAWGNQEDLQRRSILESLTRKLIKDEVLQGKVKMQMRNGKINEASWNDQLTLLLSNKTTSIRKSTPKLTSAAFWGIGIVALFAICSLLADQLISTAGSIKYYWLIDFIPVVVALVVAAVYRYKDGSFDNIFRMVDHTNNDTIEEEFSSSEEPSVVEFKNWMNAISDFLGSCEHKQKKLVMVFDNMDRLPSEKVRQFWSLIQTFFANANDGYKNIWCIVPYDESHLAAVFSDKEVDDESIYLLRGFLSKTFPVIYRVPEPIVSDYKIIFEQLYSRAFGDTVDKEDMEAISRCYRHVHPQPNVRDMISFINDNVLLAKQWKETIHPLSIAIYVLKADSMLRDPQVTLFNNGKSMVKDATTEEYLLADEYYNDFRRLLYGYPASSYLQSEIAAIVYGIEPSNAQQIIVKRHIRNCIADKENKLTFDQYVNTPQFMLLLDEDVHNMNVIEYERATMLLDKIDGNSLSQPDKTRLTGMWHYLGRQFKIMKSSVNEFTDYHRTLFSHLISSEAKACATTFCKSLVANNEVDGDKLYEHLSLLFESDFAKDFSPADICPALNIEPKRFADYVECAGNDYKRFPIGADANGLNVFLENSVSKEFPYRFTLEVLKNDEKYSVAQLGEFAVRQLDLMKADAATAFNYIDIQRIFYKKFKSKLTAEYVNTLWQSVQNEQSSPSYQEIYAIKSRNGFDQLPDDDCNIVSLCDKVLFYTTTADFIRLYLQNASVNYRRKFLVKMIGENIHDNHPDYPEFVENWQKLIDNLRISKEDMVRFADSWGYKSLSEDAQSKTYFDLLADVSWIDVLLSADTPLAKELLTKCIEELTKQNANQFVQPNTVVHTNTNWDLALQKLICTQYLNTSNLGNLSNLAIQLLDFAAKNSPFNDSTWIKLLEKVDFATISASFFEIRNKIFKGQDGYVMNAGKFQQLHSWLEQSEINTADHCSDAANQILAKVVDNEACQVIILAKKDYYRPIIANTVRTASDLHEKLKTIVKKQNDSEFSKYIVSIID